MCTDHVKTQGEDGHLQGKKRGLRRNQPCPHLDLGLPPSRNMQEYISVVETPGLYGSLLWWPYKLIQILAGQQTSLLDVRRCCNNIANNVFIERHEKLGSFLPSIYCP